MTTVLKFRYNISAYWSPVNQSWLVTWGEDLDTAAVLRSLPTEDDVREYVSSIRRVVAGEAPLEELAK